MTMAQEEPAEVVTIAARWQPGRYPGDWWPAWALDEHGQPNPPDRSKGDP